MRKVLVATTIATVVLAAVHLSLAQSGGNFEMTKSVIAGGGGASSGGDFRIDGTIGQSLAGTTSSGGGFQLTSGFWGGTAAPSSNISVSGRVTTPTGIGLRNAIVTLIDGSGVRRIATTSSFGLYTFDLVATGQNYTLTVASKRYRFAPIFVNVQGSLSNVNFTGLE